MLVDGIQFYLNVLLLIGSILFIFLGLSKLRFQDFRYAEYFALYLFAVAGFQFMVSSDLLILILLDLKHHH